MEMHLAETEGRHDLRRAHPGLDDLQGDLAADRFFLPAMYTTPMPPWSTCCSSLYGPMRELTPSLKGWETLVAPLAPDQEAKARVEQNKTIPD
jgi:hypothetical protein